MKEHSPVKVHMRSHNRKLSPVRLIKTQNGGESLVAEKPYCASTYTSIKATCPKSCAFYNQGCYASTGFAKRGLQLMDEAAAAQELTGTQVNQLEAEAIDALWVRGVPQDGGRDGHGPIDLRLHVGGDVAGVQGARELVKAAERYHWRGGGAVWGYTHRWASIPVETWGDSISMLASVESPEAAYRASLDGYVPAIVVPAHKSRRVYELGGLKIVPCPAEMGKTTCVQCRLCLDRTDYLRQHELAIGFAAHGVGAKRVRLKLLPQLPGVV